MPQLVCDTDESVLMRQVKEVIKVGDKGTYQVGREFGVRDETEVETTRWEDPPEEARIRRHLLPCGRSRRGRAAGPQDAQLPASLSEEDRFQIARAVVITEQEELTPGNEINDPSCLDWVELHDINGNPTTADKDNATAGVRRTPLAARLKAVYGHVDKVDAFVGTICEPHLPGREFGELQLAIWQRQFAALLGRIRVGRTKG